MLTTIDAIQQKCSAKVRDFIILPEDNIGVLLRHKLGSVRAGAFSVLVSSTFSTRPFSYNTLDLLRDNLTLLHSDTDAKFRNELLSNSKHMIVRLRGAVSFLAKEVYLFTTKDDLTPQSNSLQKNSAAADSQEARLLQRHTNFIRWYINFLSNELIPTASYQRHVTALRALQMAVESGLLAASMVGKLDHEADSESVWDFNQGLFTKKMVRIFLDLLMNPFEDVRTAATELLKLAPVECFMQQCYDEPFDHSFFRLSPTFIGDLRNQGNAETLSVSNSGPNRWDEVQQVEVADILISFIRRTGMASRRTGRADLADGVARAYELLCGLQVTDKARLVLLSGMVLDLEGRVTIAENNLAQAVLLAPVHGPIAAIR